MLTSLYTAVMLAALLVPTGTTAFQQETMLANCCASHADCCVTENTCCEDPLLTQTSVSDTAAIAGRPTCCAKRAYCCSIGQACCGKGAITEPSLDPLPLG